ncbi:MAG: hypothetical protein PUA59_08345, partial [Clostridium sp.]|nr:hypothetical protein [Clostridium sp.]
MLLMIFATGQVMQQSYHKKLLENKIYQVQSQCNILASQVLLNEFMISSATDNLNIEIDQLANVLEGRIIIVDSDYKIVKDTYTIEQNKYMMSTEVHDIMQGKNSSHYELIDQNQYAEIMVPILDSATVTSTIEKSGSSASRMAANANEVKKAKGVIICIVSIHDLTETDSYMQAQGRLLYALF